jgi:hypothetical protein
LRKTVLALALAALAAFAYFSTVPIDISDRIPAFRARLAPNLHGEIELASAKLTLLPRPTIYAEGFRLTSKDDDLIKAGSMKATLNPLPLLFSTYSIKKLTINDAEIFVKRYADKSLNLDKVVRQRMHDVRLKKLSIKNSKLRAVDVAAGEEASLAFFDFNADVYESSTGYAYKADGDLVGASSLSVSGDANREGEGWRLSGSLATENFDVSIFRPYVKQKRPDADVSGRADAELAFSVVKDKATIRGKLGYRDAVAAASDVFKKELRSKSGSAGVDATLDRGGLLVSLTDAKVAFEDYTVMGSAQFGGPAEDPLIKLKLSSTPVDYHTFKKLLPEEMLPPKLAGRLDAFDVKEGLVAVKELVMSGRRSELKGKQILTDAEKFRFTLNFSNFAFKYPSFRKEFSGVAGDVSLRGRDIIVDGLKGVYGDTAVVDALKGEILGLGEKVSYSLNISGSFDATEHLDEMKRFAKDLKPVHADGVVGVNVTLARRDGKNLHSGEFSFKNNTLRHDAIPLTFTNSSGRATFDPTRVNFLSLGGTNQGSSVVMDGHIEVGQGKEPYYRLKLGGKITGATASSLLKKKRIEYVSMDSPAAFSLDLSGVASALDASATLDLAQAEIVYENIIKKPRGFPSSISGAFKVSKGKATIQNADLRVGGSVIKLKGNFYLDSPLYAIDMLSNDLRAVDMDSVLQFLTDDPGSSGSAALSLKAVRESKTKPTAWHGKLSVTDGVFLTPFFKHPVEGVSFTARFNARACDVKIENLTTGESSVVGSVSLPDLSRRKAAFDLYSPNLRVEDLEAPDRNGANERARFSASGKLGAAKGSFDGKPFRALTADVTLDQKSARLDSLSVNTDFGLATGSLLYITDKSDPVLYSTDLKLRNVDLESLVERFGAQERFISGHMDAVLKLTARRGAGREGLSGDVVVASRDGKLWKFTVISKIFSLVNIFSIDQMFKEGLDYDDISGTFKVKDGLAHTEDFVFASRSLRMSAIGDVNLVDSTMDAILGFHPFVTIDAVVSKIPIAGWIITGDKKSSVSMYYKVSGPVKDPVVDPLTTQSMGENIFGVFQRLLEAPVKAVLPKEDFDKLYRENNEGKAK